MGEASYDARKYPICAPFYGTRGPAWTRRFKPDFENGLYTITDKYASLHAHLVDRSDPGNVNGPAHAGGAGAVAESQLALKARQDQTFGYILRHLENQDARDAAIAEKNAIFGAVAAGAVVAADWVHNVWQQLNTLYSLRQTALTTSNQNNEWTSTKLGVLGITRDTPRGFYNHLLRINRERQTPHCCIEKIKRSTNPPRDRPGNGQ